AELMRMVKQGGGTATLKTVEGESLTISENGMHLYVKGEKSGVAEITIPNVMQSNGVIQVINSVLLPN
ncbi:MAG: fasciclin domain-containing protein, partial [Acetobacteraceae bacterium]